MDITFDLGFAAILFAFAFFITAMARDIWTGR